MSSVYLRLDWWCVVCLLFLGLVVCSPEPRAKRPNVLLLVLDTTRADVLSSYGCPKPTTPNLDRLAGEGARFTRAFTTDFWTLPAHASLLTGLYPAEHSATSETNLLPESADTLAERLSEAGYRTRAYVSNPWVGAEFGFSQGFDSYVEMWNELPPKGTAHVFDRGAVEGASTWLGKNSEAEAPFFLFLNLNGAHLPYSPDPSVLTALTPQEHSMDRVGRLRKIKGFWRFLAGKQRLDQADFRIMRELYEAEVAMLDGVVGELIDVLRELGVLDDTLVIVTSDHGENIGEHGLIDHLLSMYDTTIRIPLIMRYPARFPPGTVNGDLLSLVDVYPTVVDICGLGQTDPDVQSRSLASAARVAPAFVIAENERPINGIRTMRHHFPSFDTRVIDRRMRMVRTDRYKLIWNEKQGVQLFDLESDPDERRDLASSRPVQRDRMLDDLTEWMARHVVAKQVSPLESREPQTLEQLRALGYFE